MKKAPNKDHDDDDYDSDDGDEGDDGDDVEDDDDEDNKSVGSTASQKPKYEVTERYPGSWRIRGAVYRVSTFVFCV